ncbi:MAG: hypothetical protein ACOCSQ_00590 [Planctomycetota bacterium]
MKTKNIAFRVIRLIGTMCSECDENGQDGHVFLAGSGTVPKTYRQNKKGSDAWKKTSFAYYSAHFLVPPHFPQVEKF